MNPTDKHQSEDASLRKKAEERLLGTLIENVESLSPEEAKRLLHELHVHQIELEMQNEELRATQQELEASRSRYFDLYDLAPVGYCTVNEHGIILQANLTAAGLLAVERREMTQRPISRFISKDDQDVYYLCRKRLMSTNQTQNCELRMMRNQETFWARLIITHAPGTSAPLALHIALSDITEYKRAETELINAKSLAEKANRAKSAFLSSMSHELRTPLTAILGFAQLMDSAAEPAPTPPQKQGLEQILLAGWHLLDLINEILDLALIESGNLSVSRSPIPLHEVLLECLLMVDPLLQKTKLQLRLPSEQHYFVEADRLRLRQILLNLLSNAAKYNKPNGEIEISYKKIAPGRLRISVRDTGEGLTPEKIEQLFQPFNRLGKERADIGGTGIGLVISKRLTELMGGSIGVESKPGEGCLFWFELMLQEAPKSINIAKAPSNEKSPHQKKHTILYVDDDPANILLLEALLGRRRDICLLTATDGRSGVALAKSAQPDLILMDIHMPEIDGFQALSLLQKDPATEHILVLALSADAMQEDIQRGLSAGFFRYMTKPIKINEFTATIDEVLNPR
jgi:PAS domain S-box-containing protein